MNKDCNNENLSLLEIQVRTANKLFETIENLNINAATIKSVEKIVDSLLKVMNVRL